jgi:hypothetical protein
MIPSIIYWIVLITLLLIGMVSIGIIWIYIFSIIYDFILSLKQPKKD